MFLFFPGFALTNEDSSLYEYQDLLYISHRKLYDIVRDRDERKR